MGYLDMLDLGNRWLNLGLWTVLIFVVITVLLGMFAVAPPVGLVGGLVASLVAAYLLLRRKG